MDDGNAFARQIAAEIDHQVGPPRPVDAFAIVRLATTPTPRWRTGWMFSAAKAVTIGALAVAIGGAMLIAQPSPQASDITPAADTDASASVLEDGTGDFRALVDYGGGEEWVQTRGPADADLVRVTVSVDGDRLAVRLETAEAVPQVPDGPDEIIYWLHIDTDGDPESEYELSSWYGDERWFSELTDTTVGDPIERGEPTMAVVEGAIVTSVALDALPVAPSDMRFKASAQVFGGFDDTYNVFHWKPIDRVPDDESVWGALGESTDSPSLAP